jgi:hypothetical protein
MLHAIDDKSSYRGRVRRVPTSIPTHTQCAPPSIHDPFVPPERDEAAPAMSPSSAEPTRRLGDDESDGHVSQHHQSRRPLVSLPTAAGGGFLGLRGRWVGAVVLMTMHTIISFIPNARMLSSAVALPEVNPSHLGRRDPRSFSGCRGRSRRHLEEIARSHCGPPIVIEYI